MVFHVIALPHVQTTKAYCADAYLMKVIHFCEMMMSLGHTVNLYASEDNDAPCTNLITCITKKEQTQLGFTGPQDYLKLDYNDKRIWDLFNANVSREIGLRKQPRDFLCIPMGYANKRVADEHPDLLSVEYGIGYGGVFTKYRVFESYAWMHTVYGSLYGPDPHAIDGQFYDAVIPNYFDPQEFPFSQEKDDYLLFIGRLTERKGIDLAVQIAEQTGRELIVCGQGEPPRSPLVQYKGMVDIKERGELMSRAAAVLCPSLYIEPFCGVSVEALFCGTPVICNDFGAFTETIPHGLAGYRCRTFGEYVWAVEHAHELDREKIRNYAVNNFSMDRVKYLYQAYFEQLLNLFDGGFYSLDHRGVSQYRRYAKIYPA